MIRARLSTVLWYVVLCARGPFCSKAVNRWQVFKEMHSEEEKPSEQNNLRWHNENLLVEF